MWQVTLLIFLIIFWLSRTKIAARRTEILTGILIMWLSDTL